MIIMNALKIISGYGNVYLHNRVSIINRKLIRVNKIYLKIQFKYCSIVYNKKFQLNEDDDFYSKIIYNEILSKVRVRKTYINEPVFLKYLMEKNKTEHDSKIETEPEIINFPFDVREMFLPEYTASDETVKDNIASAEEEPQGQWKSITNKIDKHNLEDPKKWLMSFTNDKIEDSIKYGTCDPNIAVSKIPCGGCGALLHCNDASIPGFIPKEIFTVSDKEVLREHICQRCHFLRVFNVALGVNISPAQYKEVISKIKNKVCLIIFMIDLLDFPCSIYPEVFNIIGATKPLVIVGNKLDLLMQEDHLFLNNFKESLLCSLKENNFNIDNIKHVALISAKTGYGVEDLISEIQQCWRNQGDVYLIGCTNVGKSSLFNILLQSDYCKVNAADILQRATVSAWPGTTLNLLKFPISKITSWRLIARKHRLHEEETQKLTFQRFQFLGQTVKLHQIPLTGYVGRTFKDNQKSVKLNESKESLDYKGINCRSPEFAFSKWLYDTPGVVHQDQIVNLLTTPELLLTMPTKTLIPRNFSMKPGHSLFIAGLARLDYICGPDFVWFTVFASEKLPITVTKLEDADLIYQKLLGCPLFGVPIGGKARLSKWPNLASKIIEVCGKVSDNMEYKKKDIHSLEVKDADADIVLSSAGWVSVNVRPPYRCKIEAWTPEGRGIHVRQIPLIKKGHTFRGARILKTPAYRSIVKQVPEYL